MNLMSRDDCLCARLIRDVLTADKKAGEGRSGQVHVTWSAQQSISVTWRPLHDWHVTDRKQKKKEPSRVNNEGVVLVTSSGSRKNSRVNERSDSRIVDARMFGFYVARMADELEENERKSVSAVNSCRLFLSCPAIFLLDLLLRDDNGGSGENDRLIKKFTN